MLHFLPPNQARQRTDEEKKRETASATINNDHPPKSTKSATVANPFPEHRSRLNFDWKFALNNVSPLMKNHCALASQISELTLCLS